MADGLLIGVDAGGTSTKALALNLATGERREARAEGANWTVHGPAVCAERLTAAVTEVAAGRAIQSLALCIAGFYPPDHAEAANAWARAQWPEIPHLTIQPDVHAAWAGAFSGKPGIVVISGTGSIVYGRNAAGEEARAGGWGPLYGDQGSAYALGLRTLERMSLYVDCRATHQVNMFRAAMAKWPELGSDLPSWLRGVYRERWGREEIAALGGFVAASAYRQRDNQHALMIGPVADLVDQVRIVNRILYPGSEKKTLVALQGGLGERHSYYETFLTVLDMYRNIEGYGLKVRRARRSPLEGALLLAAESVGEPRLLNRVRTSLP